MLDEYEPYKAYTNYVKPGTFSKPGKGDTVYNMTTAKRIDLVNNIGDITNKRDVQDSVLTRLKKALLLPEISTPGGG